MSSEAPGGAELPGPGGDRRAISVLLIEDSPDDAELVLRELARRGYLLDHRRVETAAALRAALEERAWDVILSDFSLPTLDVLRALALVKESGVDTPFIIVSGTVGEEAAVAALKAGAHDFIVKGQLARLSPAIDRELREAEIRASRRLAEDAFRASEERFRAIMETATDAVIAADGEGRVTYANPAAEAMFGYAAAELAGEPVAKLMPERFRAAHRNGLARFQATGQSRVVGRKVELVGQRADGSEFPIDLALGSWISSGRRFFAGFIQDISERKRVEAQLLISDRMATAGILAAGVAHEINNPLAAVIANLDLALHRVERQLAPAAASPGALGEVRTELREAREAAERVRFTVGDLRVFSRGEEGRGPSDVQEIMESTLRLAWNEVRHRARVVRDYGAVPPVEAGEARLGQVFLNLVINAAQSLPEGQADRNEIRIATRLEGERVLVEIGDTGPGISPEVLGRLFTPFITTKPAGVGTGLGLSICHRIISSLGGEITVDTAPDRGTVFRVALPAASAGVEAPPPPGPSLAAAPRRGKILIVDDEPMIARIVERLLAAEHEVTATNRAEEARARILAGERFDVILCDLMMPEMTGMDLYGELVRDAPEQAAAMIFLTGGAFTPGARAFLAAIPNETVEKPFDLHHLRALVNGRVARP